MRMIGMLVLGFIAGNVPAHGGALLESVQGPINDLISKNTNTRSTARDKIQEEFERSAPSDRLLAVDELLERIKSTSSLSDRVTAAITLSKLKSPWQASDHDNRVKDLYQLLLLTEDQTLGKYIDDALANAKGLYFDALFDFNNDRIENPVLTAGKFARMPADFPKSRYAASSAYYLGQYWTRVALIRKSFPDNISRSDEAFTSFIKRTEGGFFTGSDFLADAYYFRALNRILVGKENEAVAQLADMKGKLGSRDEIIYVYQLFYKTGDKSTVIDRYLPHAVLVDATVKFIGERPGRLPDGQSELAATLAPSK